MSSAITRAGPHLRARTWPWGAMPRVHDVALTQRVGDARGRRLLADGEVHESAASPEPTSSDTFSSKARMSHNLSSRRRATLGSLTGAALFWATA